MQILQLNLPFLHDNHYRGDFLASAEEGDISQGQGLKIMKFLRVIFLLMFLFLFKGTNNSKISAAEVQFTVIYV